MESVTIDILNPEARKIIDNLAKLNLISIRGKSSSKSLRSLLKKMRSAKRVPAMAEITREVEAVREKRYGKKG
jgi:hypothetical protein